jgi:hypothetical protein
MKDFCCMAVPIIWQSTAVIINLLTHLGCSVQIKIVKFTYWVIFQQVIFFLKMIIYFDN